MKKNIILLFVLLIGIFQIGLAQNSRRIEILNSKLIGIEPEHKDFTLTFEVDCMYSGVKDAILGFVIVPLDADLTVMLDSNGEPLMAGETIQMSDNEGEGSIELSIPLSYFPKNAEEYSYACMIVDDETLDTLADSGPLSFTASEVKGNLTQTAVGQAMGFLELLLGGGGSGKRSDGKNACFECGGNGYCKYCHGGGIYDGETCEHCKGTGKCWKCEGDGLNHGYLGL